MALEEKKSIHLGVPYVYIPDQKKFLCSNGVLFTLEEYKKGIDINAEYERREKEDKLYDYAYAKSTGLLRKKRGSKPLSEIIKNDTQKLQQNDEENASSERSSDLSRRTEGTHGDETLQGEVSYSRNVREGIQERNLPADRRNDTSSNETEEIEGSSGLENGNVSDGRTVTFICLLLLFTSLISGYISTLHTATYLYDYVDMFSAWLMSASVTAYNATAFEVSVIFKSKKRFGLTFVFITLWAMVTLFSMATTVSVFYDRFNFTETQIAEENKAIDSGKLSLELLKTKEADLREAISFKKKDIEYRQEHDYATTAVRQELEKLQKELQENLTEQQKLLSDTPEITEKVTKRKESLFSFLGRLLHMEGGVLEFIMSTLSAIFVNLIAPLSLTAVTELLKKKVDNINYV